MTEDHAEIQSLLGAFVLNSVSDIERRRVERHISTCAECAREVQMLSETSAELAWLERPEAADELVDRISASLPRRPRRMASRVVAGVAAVSVAAAAFLGVVIARERSASDELARIVATAERTSDLRPQAGFEGEGTLFVADDKAALVLDEMPDPGRDRAYQLWAISANEPESLAVVAGNESIVRVFRWNGRADRFAVTIEPADGSPVPTSDPVLIGG
jgi:anti-sigma-K factor RskA